MTTFKPQSPVMARPEGVKLSRKGARLRVSWKRVTGATAYEVAVTPSSRRMVFARTRGRRASLRVPGWDSGRVTVRAIDDLRQSPTRRPPLQGRAERPSAFRSFPRCKVSKKKINCGKSKTKVGPSPRRRARPRRRPARSADRQLVVVERRGQAPAGARARQAELRVGVRQVRLNRLRADHQRPRDLGRGGPVRRQARDP